MNPNHRSTTCFRRAATAALVLTGAMLVSNPSAAEEMYKTEAHAGGLRIGPEIKSLTVDGGTAKVTWYGLRGNYTLQGCPTMGGAWTDITTLRAADYETNASATVSGDFAMFRLKANNSFNGSSDCADCHDEVAATWSQTPHAKALSSLEALNLPPAVMQGCLPCHTIGYGQPTGFIDTNVTANLADVGCESCHGAAGSHMAGSKRTIRPATTIAAELCGGCHTDSHHPTFDEWSESGHAHVSGNLGEEFEDPSYNGKNRQMSCGACHSGAVRNAMLKNYNATGGATNSTLALPASHDAGEYGITCVVCHDPHIPGEHASLRNPNYSTNFYSFPTTTYPVTNSATGEITWLNDNFAKNYNPNVQVCAQCHNMRGGTWTSSGRPPHHSPQYNIMIGLGGYPFTNGVTAAITHKHGLGNQKQCTQCHMKAVEQTSPTDENPNDTGHRFEMNLLGCVAAGCHPTTDNANECLVDMKSEIKTTINEVVGLMQQWSTVKAPTIDAGFTQYSTNAWEFTSAGQLTTKGGASVAGPNNTLQSKIPNDIKQARFNLYLVEHDASYGVHNPEYVRILLEDAKTRVNRAMQ